MNATFDRPIPEKKSFSDADVYRMIRSLQDSPLTGTALSRPPGDLADPHEQALAQERAMVAAEEIDWGSVRATLETLITVCCTMEADERIAGYSRHELRDFLLRMAERGGSHTETITGQVQGILQGHTCPPMARF